MDRHQGDPGRGARRDAEWEDRPGPRGIARRLVRSLPWSTGERDAVIRGRVPQDRVVRGWLERELGPSGRVPDGSRAALDALLSEKPGAAGFVWRDAPVEWYRIDLGETAFRELRPVPGPEDLLWRSVSTDGTLAGVAERIHESEGPGSDAGTAAAAGVNADALADYRAALARGDPLDPLVVHTRRGLTPWFVADGNHRAVAVELHRLETGDYEPVPAFLGVTANPVLGPLVDRVRGWIRRLGGRLPARRR